VADNVPDDLVALKVAFWAAQAKYRDLARLPAVSGARRQRHAAELVVARRMRNEVIAELNAHPWWGRQANSFEAEDAVTTAAMAVRHGAR
jgi:hypothetical protein